MSGSGAIRASEARPESYVRVLVMASIVAIGGLLFGFDTGIVAGAIVQIKKLWQLSPLTEGMIVSGVLVGGLIGAAISGKAADVFGRGPVISATAVIFVVAAFWTGLGTSPASLGLGRIVIGIAVGSVSVAVPLYLSEIAPAPIRGAVVTLNQLALVGGVLCSYMVSAYFSPDPDGWRYMLMMGAAPAVVLGYAMLFLPSSPRWLLAKNREGSARRMLRRLGVRDAHAAIEDIKLSIRDTSKATWRELFVPAVRPALLVGIGLTFFQQCSGITIVVYYATTIFGMTGFSSASVAPLLTVGIGMTNLAATIAATFFVDRLGRRTLLLAGTAVTTVCLVLFVVGFAGLDHFGPLGRWLVVASLFCYIGAFSLSLGPVCGLVVSEIYPQRVRGVAMSFVIALNWTFQIIVTLTFPSLIAALGPSWTFLIYTFIGVAGFAFCYALVPETGGLSLEEIEAHWKAGDSPRQWQRA
jgi:sugar porter (SP) family MFS transporter